MRLQLEHQSLVRMLKEAIYSMCKNSLPYDLELNVEGLIGITLDKRDIFLVNINESFQPIGLRTTDRNNKDTRTSPETSSSRKRRKRRRGSADSLSDDSELSDPRNTSSAHRGQGQGRTNREDPEEIDAIVIKEEVEYSEDAHGAPIPDFEFRSPGESIHRLHYGQDGEEPAETKLSPSHSQMLSTHGATDEDFDTRTSKRSKGVDYYWPYAAHAGGETSVTTSEQGYSSSTEEKQHTVGIPEPPEQLYRCRYCGREYQTKAGRYLHEKLHNGQAFICRKCGKAFSSRAHLQRHMFVHNMEPANHPSALHNPESPITSPSKT